MDRLKKFLETAFIVVFVLIGLVVLLPVMMILQITNISFLEARPNATLMLGAIGASSVGYGGYLFCNGWMPDVVGATLFLVMVGLAVLVGVWNWIAIWLWHRNPEWLEAIQPEEREWNPTGPEKLNAWLKRNGERIVNWFSLVGLFILLAMMVGLPAALGSTGWALAMLLALVLGGLPVIGALLWPVLMLLAWLPRIRKRKFGEFFCAATRNAEIAVFGQTLEQK